MSQRPASSAGGRQPKRLPPFVRPSTAPTLPLDAFAARRQVRNVEALAHRVINLVGSKPYDRLIFVGPAMRAIAIIFRELQDLAASLLDREPSDVAKEVKAICQELQERWQRVTGVLHQPQLPPYVEGQSWEEKVREEQDFCDAIVDTFRNDPGVVRLRRECGLDS